MRKTPNLRSLDEHISRALNKIKKLSTAEEITELLNRDLEPEDRPFQTKEVAERLRNIGDIALTLYPQSILCCVPNPVSTTRQVQQITKPTHARTFVHEVSLILGKEEQNLPIGSEKGLTQPC